jgi:hypothetical protein
MKVEDQSLTSSHLGQREATPENVLEERKCIDQELIFFIMCGSQAKISRKGKKEGSRRIESSPRLLFLNSKY